MRIVLFYHSLLSDWNHGNAHFLRGTITELLRDGHDVRVYEPEGNWSLQNLIADAGEGAVAEFRQKFPHLTSRFYTSDAIDLDEALARADLVLVHEWNDPDLIARVGEHRKAKGGYLLLFHDTHHRSVSAPHEMQRMDLLQYDAVLAFGNTVRDAYLKNGWHDRIFTWHEAADTNVFQPVNASREGDLIWAGNWGDDERAAELEEFLIRPCRDLKLKARVHGVRYPRHAIDLLAKAGIEYAGYLPNYKVPETFARYALTVHVPRRPYVRMLPGIPTIRPFEALACGTPLISAPWSDTEGLFAPGQDYLIAQSGIEMKQHLRRLLDEPALRHRLADRGRATIRCKHTCRHRVEQLMSICGYVRQLRL